MGTLLRKLPKGEYLDGYWMKNNKDTGKSKGPIHFNYKNLERDEIQEFNPLPYTQEDKFSNVIYTSDAIKFNGSDMLRLEDQPHEKKVVFIRYDRSKSKETDRRLSGVKNKENFLGKLLFLE